MIVFELAPNEALSSTLQNKMSPFMIEVSEIPVFWLGKDTIGDISEKDIFQQRIVKKADIEYMIKSIIKNINNVLDKHIKDFKHYFKHYIKKDEAFNVCLTLYFFDTHKNQYAYLKKDFSITFDNAFIVMLKKPKKRQKQYALFYVLIQDCIIDLYKILMSERYEPLALNDYLREYHSIGSET